MADRNNLFLDIGQCSLIKHSETICGDYCCVIREEDKVTAVLSDGLGSGVKANILATLTSKILSTLIAKNIPLDECVYTVASTLPMCSERKLAYATFTVIQLKGDTVYLVQYDNPAAILLRDGRSTQYDKEVHFYGEKQILVSRFSVRQGDMIILMSDGIINAGMGKNMTDGWKHEEVEAFLEGWWSQSISPKRMASCLCEAANDLSLQSTDDDTTVMACKICSRQSANVLIGPPHDPQNDREVLKRFFQSDGLHIICGGTTSKLAADYLGKSAVPMPETASERVPAISKLDGADLVTEGFLTLQEAVRLAQAYTDSEMYGIPNVKAQDGASLLCRMLFEQANDISIYFGTAENDGNASLEMDLNSKLALVRILENLLKKQGKNVKLNIC